MRTGRKWTFLTAGIALLSLGLDAAAQKHAQPLPGVLDLRPPWSGPAFRGLNSGVVPGSSGGANSSIASGASPGTGSSASAGIGSFGKGAASPSVPATIPDGRGSPVDRGVPANPGPRDDSRGSPVSNDPPGRGGDMPDKSSNSRFPGKGKDDTPGENLQVVVEHGASPARPLHVIPTCR